MSRQRNRPGQPCLCRPCASGQRQVKGGLFSSGGLSITVGKQQQSTDQQNTATGAAATTIGAVPGDVNIVAGQNYRQTGGDLIAPQGDIKVLAQKIDITEARETRQTVIEQKSRQSGLTIAITSPVISAVQTVQSMAQAAGNTGDSRMQALAAGSAALAAKSGYDAVQAGQGVTTPDGKAGQIATKVDGKGKVLESRDANLADQAGGINLSISISISIGGSQSQSQSKTVQSSSTAQGSTLTAGRDIKLQADNDIKLLSAQSTADQKSSNSSISGSVGISIGSSGFGVTVAASGARGKADGNDVTQTNTQIVAGNRIDLESGNDTTLKGAVVSAEQVTARVGGDLAIESLQDTSQYASKQQSLGGSVTVGAGISGSVSASRSNTNSTYASVTEQSGIRAGDGGFQVNVKGNTDLKGGAITSSDKAVTDNKNTLTTASLTQSDIQNKADASASSSGIDLSTDMLSQGKYGLAKAVLGNALNNASESGSSSGQTLSAVSAGMVTILDEEKQQQLTGKTAEATVASLNRNTANAHTAAQKQDVQAMKQTVEAERAIKQAVVAQAVKFSDEAYRKMFIANHPMYEVVKDKDGNTQPDEKTGRPILRELSEQEKTNLKPGPDGKIHIATNGIFNDAVAAGTYADQHSTVQGPQYVIHFPEANNVISELMVAGYQKFLENDFWGLSNSVAQVKDAMSQYGQSGLHLDGHSRGAMTIGNALESQGNAPNARGSLSNTTINFFGPAYNAQQADNLLGTLQDRQSLPAAQQPATVLQFQNHAADPVGGLSGQNPPTGGTIPEDSSPAREAVRAATGQPVTVHNCYGRSSERACEGFWQDTGGYPVLIPATALPAQGAPR